MSRATASVLINLYYTLNADHLHLINFECLCLALRLTGRECDLASSPPFVLYYGLVHLKKKNDNNFTKNNNNKSPHMCPTTGHRPPLTDEKERAVVPKVGVFTYTKKKCRFPRDVLKSGF
jgi:hypothetical protein